MADNLTVTVTEGAIEVATHEAGGVHTQRVAPSAGALTDRSGTITTGGTSQQIAAANAARRYLFVQNISDTVAYLNFTTAASAAAGSIMLPANGGAITFEGLFVPTEAVNIIGATTGKAFTAKEG